VVPMELSRAEEVAGALRRHGIPAYTEYTGGGIFLAQVDLVDGTQIQLGEDESGFGWQRTEAEKLRPASWSVSHPPRLVSTAAWLRRPIQVMRSRSSADSSNRATGCPSNADQDVRNSSERPGWVMGCRGCCAW
jgi:hypothetical protein